MSNFSNLKRQAENLLIKMEGKRYKIKNLNERLQNEAEKYPNDTVIKAVASVIDQMYYKNPQRIISQLEFENIYNELIGLNASGTNFREIFGDLLLSEKQYKKNINNEYIKGMRDDESEMVSYSTDKEVKDCFDDLFKESSDKYNPKSIPIVKNKIEMELKSLGYDNSKIKLTGGNSKLFVFSANIDSNRGIFQIFIPIEASGNKFPEFFIIGNKIEKLTKENIKKYIDLVDNKNINFFQDERKSIDLPIIPVPKELKFIASNMEENILETAVGYPQTTVKLAKQIIITELSSMGFKGTQVKVAAPTQDGFICDVVVNSPKGKVNIEVPIEIKNNTPLIPSVFAKNDYISDFTEANIKSFLINENCNSYNSVENDNQLYSMNVSELKNIIIKAASNKKFDICNEALEVLSYRVNEDDYRNIVSDYFKILANIENIKESMKKAYNDSNQFVKTPNSIFPIHKILGRPAHELIRDEDGRYYLKSSYISKKYNNEGAFFSNSKILL